jgi:hypothetical protein
VQDTNYVAVYAAVLSTLVALWNFYRDIWRERVRLEISLRCYGLFTGFTTPDPLLIIAVEVVNRSTFAVKVNGAGIHVGEEINGVEDPHLQFTNEPQLAALGYSLPFTVPPREMSKSAILDSALREHIDATAGHRSVRVRAFIQLADGSFKFGKWETLQVTQEGMTLKA